MVMLMVWGWRVAALSRQLGRGGQGFYMDVDLVPFVLPDPGLTAKNLPRFVSGAQAGFAFNSPMSPY